MISILLVIFSVLVFHGQLVYSQYNTTILAGTEIPGWTGDNGPATSAKVNFVTGCFVDSNSNTFFTDMYSYVVRKVNTAGIITTIGGIGSFGNVNTGGAFTSVKLANPWGIVGNSNSQTIPHLEI
jgi:hypothetical protein